MVILLAINDFVSILEEFLSIDCRLLLWLIVVFWVILPFEILWLMSTGTGFMRTFDLDLLFMVLYSPTLNSLLPLIIYLDPGYSLFTLFLNDFNKFFKPWSLHFLSLYFAYYACFLLNFSFSLFFFARCYLDFFAWKLLSSEEQIELREVFNPKLLLTFFGISNYCYES